MTLSTTTPSTPRTRQVATCAPDLGALVRALSAGVHGALVAPHADGSPRTAVAFASATVALTVAALGLALFPGPGASWLTAALLLAVTTAYLLSRTSGIPGLVYSPEPFDPLGSTMSLLEVATAAVLTGQLDPRRNR